MKLSKTMIEVMEVLNNSKHYYLDNTEKHRTVEHMYLKGETVSYHRGGYILKDGSIGIVGNTSTLKALEKRGLIEIVEIGGEDMDIVKMDKQFKAPLKTVSKINVHTKYTTGSGKVYDQDEMAYMEHGALEEVQAKLNEKYASRGGAVVTIIGDVDLDVWQPIRWDNR